MLSNRKYLIVKYDWTKNKYEIIILRVINYKLNSKVQWIIIIMYNIKW